MSLRDRLGARLRESKLATCLELLIVPLLFGLQAAGILAKPKLPLLLFGWLSLWLRRVGWRGVGLRRPKSWLLTIVGAIVIGVAYDALDIGVLLPLLHRITGEPLDLSGLGPLKGNVETLAVLVFAGWVSGAFPEELLYRGYLLNRLADIMGRTVTGWAVSATLVSLVFAYAHRAQGITGVLDNVFAGALFATLYFVSGRNLWLPLLTHGVIDTTSAVLLYLGVHP